MRYSPDTLSSYASLFDHAHEAVKEAALFARAGRRVKGFFDDVGQSFRGAKRGYTGELKRDSQRLSQAEEEAARQTELAESLTNKSRAQDLDAAVLKRQLETAQKDFQAQYGAKASPEAFDDALRSARSYKGLGLAGLGLGGAGVAAGIPLAYHTGKQEGEGNHARTRNLAFGVGAASGLAAPHVIQGLGRIARGASGTGLFPGLQGISPTYASDMYGGGGGGYGGGGGGYGGGY